MTTSSDSTKVAVVDSDLHYRRIDKDTQRGAKMLLIRKDAGVAQVGTLSSSNTFFDHWFPLPTFADDAVQ